MKLHISNGNSKLGGIPNISLPPIITCRKGVPCANKCYARKFYKLYPTCKTAWDENLELLRTNSSVYWAQLWEFLDRSKSNEFRYHTSGDIVDTQYLKMMIKTARRFKDIKFLCFTKRDDIVNDVLLSCRKPKNLKLILSAWQGYEPSNPYNLPIARVIFKGEEPQENWKICGGNCTECACRGVGCWELKKGETIAFYEH